VTAPSIPEGIALSIPEGIALSIPEGIALSILEGIALGVPQGTPRPGCHCEPPLAAPWQSHTAQGQMATPRGASQ
jgi:hypothetical protein